MLVQDPPVRTATDDGDHIRPASWIALTVAEKERAKWRERAARTDAGLEDERARMYRVVCRVAVEMKRELWAGGDGLS